MYCLSTDTQVELCLLADLKLLVRTHCHIWRKQKSFKHKLDTDILKQQQVNMAVINHNYTKTCFFPPGYGLTRL